MNTQDPLNIEDASVESEGQEALKQPAATEQRKKKFVEPTISDPIDVLKTTAFFFDAIGESDCFGEPCP